MKFSVMRLLIICYFFACIESKLISIETFRAIQDEEVTISCPYTNTSQSSRGRIIKIESHSNDKANIDSDASRIRFRQINEEIIMASKDDSGLYGCLSDYQENVLTKCLRLKVYEKIILEDSYAFVEARSAVMIDLSEHYTEHLDLYSWVVGDNFDHDWSSDTGIHRERTKLWIDSFGCDRINVYGFTQKDWTPPYHRIFISIKDFIDPSTTTLARVFHRQKLITKLKVNYDRPIEMEVYKVGPNYFKRIEDREKFVRKEDNHFEFVIPSVRYEDGGKYFFNVKCSENDAGTRQENVVTNYFQIDVFTMYDRADTPVPLRDGEDIALVFNSTFTTQKKGVLHLTQISGHLPPNVVVEDNMVYIHDATCENEGNVIAFYGNRQETEKFDLKCPTTFREETVSEDMEEDYKQEFTWSKMQNIYRINAGQPLNLECTVSILGLQNLKIVKLDSSGPTEIMVNVISSKKKIKGRLVPTMSLKVDLPAVNQDHIGTYRCIAEAKSGLILLHDRKDFHVVPTYTMNYTLARNQRVDIDCGIFQFPNSTYVWKFQNERKETEILSNFQKFSISASFSTPKGPYKCFIVSKTGTQFAVMIIRIQTANILPDSTGAVTYALPSNQPIILNFSRFGKKNLKKVHHFVSAFSRPRVLKLAADQTLKIPSLLCRDLGTYQISKIPLDPASPSLTVNFDTKTELVVWNYKKTGKVLSNGRHVLIRDPDDNRDNVIVDCSIVGTLPSKINKRLIIKRNGKEVVSTNRTSYGVQERYPIDGSDDLWECVLIVYCRNEEILVHKSTDLVRTYIKHDFNIDVLILENNRNYAILPTPQYSAYTDRMRWSVQDRKNSNKTFEEDGIIYITDASDTLDGVCLREDLTGEQVVLVATRTENEPTGSIILKDVIFLTKGASETITCKSEGTHRMVARIEKSVSGKTWEVINQIHDLDIRDVCTVYSDQLPSELSHTIINFNEADVGYYRCVYIDYSSGFRKERYRQYEVLLEIPEGEQPSNDDPGISKIKPIQTTDMWIEPEKERFVTLGKSTFFTCLAVGDIISMQIVKSDNQVISSNMTRGLDEIYRIFVEIRPVHEENYGAYKCLAEANVKGVIKTLERDIRITRKT